MVACGLAGDRGGAGVRRRHKIAVWPALALSACSGGTAHISAPKARESVTSTAPSATGQPAEPEVVGPGADTTLPSDPGPATQSLGPGGHGAQGEPATGLETGSRSETTIRENSIARSHVPVDVDEVALASWYGEEFRGSLTASGEPFDPDELTFAHRTLAFGTQARFCGPSGCVVATCTDRGPAAWTGKTFDLSRAAFARIAPLGVGVAEVEWAVVA